MMGDDALDVSKLPLVAGGESVSVLPFWSQSSRGWGSATALEVKKKKVASQTVIRSSKELDFSDTLLANVIESLPT
jgi:hypothetical protein